MKVELRKWTFEDKEALIEICNRIEEAIFLTGFPTRIRTELRNGG